MYIILYENHLLVYHGIDLLIISMDLLKGPWYQDICDFNLKFITQVSSQIPISCLLSNPLGLAV